METHDLPSVSAIIPAWNAERSLEDCVASLTGQTHPPIEILVVDDGSTDGTAALAAALPVRLVGQSHQGPSSARNHGARLASGKILFFVEADASYSERYVERCVRKLVGTPGGGTILGALHCWPRGSWLDAYWTEMRRLSLRSYRPFSGWFYRMSDFRRLGGFREDLFHGEDVDLARRLRESGRSILFEPEARWYHRYPSTLSEWLRKSFGYGLSTARGDSSGRALIGASARLLLFSLATLAPLLLLVSRRTFAAALLFAGVQALFFIYWTFRIARTPASPLSFPHLLLYAPLTLLNHAAYSLGILVGLAGTGRRNKEKKRPLSG